MRVLITGGAGYIGSVLVPRLLRDGHRVDVLDNFMYRQTPLLDWVCDPNLTIVRGDARDPEQLAPLVKKADWIVPLACLTGAPACDRDPTGATTVVLDAVDRILELRGASQAIFYPTTNSGYGIGEEGIHCTEDTPLRPVSLYGRLKVDAERRCMLDAGGAVTLRLATAFGMSPRMRLDLLVNDFTYRAVTDRCVVLYESHFKRNFHVRDISEAFLHAMENFDAMRDQAYNVGLDDANLSKAELCEVIRKHVPDFWWTEAELGEDPDKRNYIVSNAKIRAAGFVPEFSLEAGIQELVKGYQILRRNEHSNV